MGAIVAIIGESGDPELPVRLQRMLGRSPYRGTPEHHVEHGVALGIQARNGDASLTTAGNWRVAVHGFIGNWAELASTHRWSFPDDTSHAARVAVAYEDLGRTLFSKLRGEFSMLIYDRRLRTLIAVRDVPGCRPLFHLAAEGRRFLATEIRQLHAGAAIPPDIDDDGLIQDVMWRYPDRERTHFRNVTRVLPGRIATIGPAGTDRPRHLRPYWRPPPENRGRYDVRALTEELRAILDQSLDRSQPGKPFAVSLSGGIDSSALFCLIADRARRGDPQASMGHPYSFVFPGLDSDESERIRLVHEATQSHGALVDGNNIYFGDSLESLARNIDGLHLGSLFLLDMIAREMERDGRGAVLLGVGGDEWLFGSLSYLAEELFSGRVLRFSRDLFRYQLDPGVRRFDFVVAYTVNAAWKRIARLRSSTPWRPSWLHPDRPLPMENRGPQLAELDDSGSISRSRRGVLGTLLMVQDLHQRDTEEQLFASRGLEQRLPLMDLDLIEFVCRTPGRAITDGQRDKHLLRRSVHELLPPPIRDGMTKVHYETAITRDLDRIKKLMPPSKWELVERKIATASELAGLFTDAKRPSEARTILPALIVAESVLKENT